MDAYIGRIISWVEDRARTLRVAASYLLIIMAMSIGFSFVFYHTSAHELGRQVPPDSLLGQSPDADYDSYHDFFQQRIDQGRGDLLSKLILINLVTLVLGGFFSYLLARHTLQPIENALDAQSRFASDASHELRTPLAVIQSENEVALRSSKLSLPRAKELLQSNLDEVTRLQGLSEGLLSLAHDSNDITPVPVSLADISSEAINGHIKAAQLKEIDIEDIVPDIRVMADERALTQTLSVLLDNAIKYSDKGSTVKIEGSAGKKDAFLAVTDKGIGIKQQDIPQIFDRFYRADTSRSKQHVEGHGLGLPLAQKLVKQIGGDITVTSRPGKGSTFTVKLPLA